MKYCYVPQSFNWPFSPDFIASCLVYDMVQLPVAEEVNLLVNEIFHTCKEMQFSNIHSWTDISTPDFFTRDTEATYNYSLLKECGLVEDIIDPVTVAPKYHKKNVRFYELSDERNPFTVTRDRFLRRGANVIDEYRCMNDISAWPIIGENYSEPYVFSLLFGQTPQAFGSSLNNVEDKQLVESKRFSDLLRTTVHQALPEVSTGFTTKSHGNYMTYNTYDEDDFKRLVEFLVNVRDGSKDGRYAWRDFIAQVTSIPWEEEQVVIDSILSDKQNMIVESYHEYRKPILSQLNKHKVIVNFGSLMFNLVTLNVFGAAKDSTDLLKVDGVLSKQEQKAYAFLHTIETELSKFAEKS